MTEDKRHTLKAFLDVIIPADESPSASALRVDIAIVAKSARDRRFLALLWRGCDWLDKQAKSLFGIRLFHLLDESMRQKIVSFAAESSEGSLPAIFFERLRRETFFYYYGNPLSWKSIDYDGPPQPSGFPDHSKPPGFSP
ncbi:MAG: gluconate 2-dehydrogenase subunit 3 family protein [Nitrospirae bacterium]|uniref:gluconate 2-dehydrogenase subunit 3 family protein n=1 Tax=Candidatus Magnetobacterium casense TaxID=1455061 RepID=UPI000590F820|nr:gluconate 2-dehydrogenase subunit 3 family protein [Candidatus Magnetobacterium casensis]MBF0337855.1 gluconate 2-dehydrogenase subunit 3 family protein [Nitrospirota bacterium]